MSTIIDYLWKALKWLARGYAEVYRAASATVRFIMILVPFLAVLFLCRNASLALHRSPQGPTPETVYVVVTGSPSRTPRPTATRRPAPTRTPRPTPAPTLAPMPALEAAIRNALGSSNRPSVQRVGEISLEDGRLEVRWAINDSLFWLADGAREDLTDIVHAVASSGLDYDELHALGSFSTKDKFGNSAETVVVDATFTKSTVGRINWAGFRATDIYDIADRATVHPDLR